MIVGGYNDDINDYGFGGSITHKIKCDTIMLKICA